MSDDPYAGLGTPVQDDPYAGLGTPTAPHELPHEQRNQLLQDKILSGASFDEARDYAVNELRLQPDERALRRATQRHIARVRSEEPPAPPPGPPPDTSFGHDAAVIGRATLYGLADAGKFGADVIFGPERHLADMLGAPKPEDQAYHILDSAAFGRPQTPAQNYAFAGTRMLAAAAPTGAAGTVRQAALTGISAVTSGLSGEAARQAGYGPKVQFAASLAGGLLPAAGPLALARRVPIENLPEADPAQALPPTPRGPIAAFNRVTGRDTTAGARLVAQRLADDGINPNDAGRVMSEAHANGTPLALADMGENTRALAGSVTRTPGPARTMGKSFTKERQMGQMDRVRDAINRDLGPTTDVIEESGRRMQQAKDAAAPIYEEALAGGSIAPLERQFQTAFGQSSAEVAAARGDLADAQNRATQASADLSRGGGNVYGSSAGLRAQREGSAAIDAAQQRLSQAQAAHESNLARLRQAQADGSANAPGAVWSPRIQQFLDDPITKSGLAKGLEVQRLESLAEGRPFNASEYAITGTDTAGNPIVASVPNMRTLDAVKRGFDEILGAYPRSPGGKLILDQRGRAVDMARKAFIKEVDRINPRYADARAAYAGPAQLRDALEDGKSALNKSPSEINARIRGMSDPEIEQYGLGLRSAMADALKNAPDGANRVRSLVGNPKRREVLNLVFGGKANLDRFVSTLENEQAAFETYHAVHGGSPTQPRAVEDQANSDTNLLRGLGSDVAAVAGGPLNIGTRLIERGGDLLRFGAGKGGQRTREDAASLLFSTSPLEFENALGEIALQGRRNLYRRRAFRPVAGASAVAANQPRK